MSGTAPHHASLRRQLRRLGLAADGPPDRAQWTELLALVSDSYQQADEGRYTLERSIELSSAEMRSLHDVLSRQANQDALTGLPNRSALTEILGAALSHRGSGTDAAVLFIDLDGFKRVNDGLGHSVGDELLVRTAERIRSAVRGGDVVGRLGGDEFVVLCPDVQSADVAVQVARRIAEQLERPYHFDGMDASVSASIGIAIAVPGTTSADDMLRQADIAMYEAKTRGRSGFAIFDEEMRRRVDGRLSTEVALRNALARDEFVLHYQPVVRLSDHRVLGVEALIRWERPGQGLVLPGAFVDVAEQSRLITAIDAWVVRQACADMAQCQETEISVAVNLSGRDLEDESLLDAVSQALHRTGLASHRLMVELTETMLLAEGAHVAAHLAQIQSLGVQVAIDDFGTGYSSLSYLRRLPVQALKIDRSFVASIDHDEVAAAIVGAVVAMSHALGLHVVAEGVERPGQEIRLRQLGCDAAQGYLFARPQPIAEALLAVRALDGSPVATVPPPPPETTAGLHRN